MTGLLEWRSKACPWIAERMSKSAGYERQVELEASVAMEERVP